MDNNYELESRIASASRPTLAPPAAVAADPPASISVPVEDPHAMARGDGFDLTPIVTHYVFLVTFVLAIVSDIFPLRGGSARRRVDTIFTIKQVGWMTAFIGQVVLEAVSTASTSLPAVDPAQLSSQYNADPPTAGTLWFGILYAWTNLNTLLSLADNVALRF